jgi:hypothetical protein
MTRRALLSLVFAFALSADAATYTSGSPSTTNNDDSCDVAALPAATLLLPYFEVDFNAPQAVARTTLFTVVNTTQQPQIARVVLWTDWAYPVLDFNLFLTGYDVQAINLYDILGPRGIIASPGGTSSSTPEGARSLPNAGGNPNFSPNAMIDCARLPGAIPAFILVDMRNALSNGTVFSCETKVGSTHRNAVGYATIDLVSTCGVALPVDAGYYNQQLYDNVLTGDYQWIDPNATTGNYAGGNPLVHIRAVPEGGKAGVIAETNLPYTFYDRYTPGNARQIDRRQPLPSAFSSRYIQGGAGAFNTELRIWREGVIGGNPGCGTYGNNNGSGMRVADLVRFDEHENPTSIATTTSVVLPVTSSTPTSSALFPPIATASGDVAGWLYLNLNNGGSASYSAKAGRNYAINGTTVRPSQNWVVTSMFAEGRFQAAFDATAFANGCTPAPAVTGTTNPIAPGPNVNP